MFDAACENIERFSFIGITEHFDLSVERLCECFGLKAHPTRKGRHRNVSTPQRHRLATEERETIMDANRLDAVIYEDCVGRFLAQE